ncbi:MAG: hypothetical protein RL419_1696, partial [Actinomycetota bacterium]
ARVCATFNGEVVHENVDLFGGNARLHDVASPSQNVGRHDACMSHAFDDIGCLDASFVGALHHTGVGIVGLYDVARHRTHGADHARLNASLGSLVTPLVLTTTAAPAGVVRGGEYVGDCRHSVSQATAESGGSAQPVYCCLRE